MMQSECDTQSCEDVFEDVGRENENENSLKRKRTQVGGAGKNNKKIRPKHHKSITPGVYSPPDSHYSHAFIPETCKDIIHMIMGRKGYHFKNITSISGAEYIWYNSEKCVVEVWGHPKCHENAARLLYGHMDSCYQRYLKKKMSVAANDNSEVNGTEVNDAGEMEIDE